MVISAILVNGTDDGSHEVWNVSDTRLYWRSWCGELKYWVLESGLKTENEVYSHLATENKKLSRQFTNVSVAIWYVCNIINFELVPNLARLDSAALLGPAFIPPQTMAGRMSRLESFWFDLATCGSNQEPNDQPFITFLYSYSLFKLEFWVFQCWEENWWEDFGIGTGVHFLTSLENIIPWKRKENSMRFVYLLNLNTDAIWTAGFCFFFTREGAADIDETGSILKERMKTGMWAWPLLDLTIQCYSETKPWSKLSHNNTRVASFCLNYAVNLAVCKIMEAMCTVCLQRRGLRLNTTQTTRYVRIVTGRCISFARNILFRWTLLYYNCTLILFSLVHISEFLYTNFSSTCMQRTHLLKT